VAVLAELPSVKRPPYLWRVHPSDELTRRRAIAGLGGLARPPWNPPWRGILAHMDRWSDIPTALIGLAVWIVVAVVVVELGIWLANLLLPVVAPAPSGPFQPYY